MGGKGQGEIVKHEINAPEILGRKGKGELPTVSTNESDKEKVLIKAGEQVFQKHQGANRGGT